MEKWQLFYLIVGFDIGLAVVIAVAAWVRKARFDAGMALAFALLTGYTAASLGPELPGSWIRALIWCALLLVLGWRHLFPKQG